MRGKRHKFVKGKILAKKLFPIYVKRTFPRVSYRQNRSKDEILYLTTRMFKNTKDLIDLILKILKNMTT
ncbi:hypothetical protein CEE45_01415 [Candidatus Heimdallarchaeota archaeon B3_Heim]|nr:MAG: hypothetical protein CEE45_01415 [Candidatus Heimdallarchaeota archaeon B3_Heim]